MFTISKKTITAQVSLNDGRVKVIPLILDQRFVKAQTAILSHNCLLAQLHLSRFNWADFDAALSDYFELNGWVIA